MQKPVPGLPFTFPGQLSCDEPPDDATEDVITLMLIPMLSGQSGEQLSPIEGDVPGR